MKKERFMVLGTVLATIGGALIAGMVGLLVQLIIEGQKRRIAKERMTIQLRCYLTSVIGEIESNVDILPDLRKGAGGEQLVFTRLGDSILPALSGIPLPCVPEAVTLIGRLYNYYDKVNRIWAKTIEENKVGEKSKRHKVSEIKKGYKEKTLKLSTETLSALESLLQRLK